MIYLPQVVDAKKKEVAQIEKIITGAFKEMYTGADDFKVNFKGLDNRTKTILLGTVFFLVSISDQLYYLMHNELFFVLPTGRLIL